MVVYQKNESIAMITLNRPDEQNRINIEVADALRDIRRQINQDESVKVIIITGQGNKTFCSGVDSEAFNRFEDKTKRIKLFSVALTMGSFKQPVIAAINGDTFGQGLELALSCDLRICSKSAKFAMPHLADNEMPWDGGTQRLSRLVGRGKAIEMILLAETMDAVEAHRIGLVHQVVPQAKLSKVVVDMARQMAEMSPISLAYAKEAIQKGMDLTLRQGLGLEADLYYLIHTTKDRTEGIEAFREKRRPRFEGK